MAFSMSLALTEFICPVHRYGRDIGPCTECKGCRPDITNMVAPATDKPCVMCGTAAAKPCSGCLDARYCSAICQKDDWPVHKLLCREFRRFSLSARPSNSHFRALIFPQKASQPAFVWVQLTGTETKELRVSHPIIDGWKTVVNDRYKDKSGVNIDLTTGPFRIHALTRDFCFTGKKLGHGLKLVFWDPPSGKYGYLDGYNETVRSVANKSRLSFLLYGPVVAFAYILDADFSFKDMDHVGTGDLRHITDYFHNSRWNAAIGDAPRFPQPAVPSLFVPDLSCVTAEAGSGCSSELSKRLNLTEYVISQTIPARINREQACFHALCGGPRGSISKIPDMCLNGSIWHSFLFGPLMLGLPWVGRNTVIADIHSDNRHHWPASRWKRTLAMFLCQDVRLTGRNLVVLTLNPTDGLMVFHAFGQEIHPLHLYAYRWFVANTLRGDGRGSVYSKEDFVKAWSDLKTGAFTIAIRGKVLDFSTVPSPYECPPRSQSVLPQDMTEMLQSLTSLLGKEKHKTDFQQLASEALNSNYQKRAMWVWAIPDDDTNPERDEEIPQASGADEDGESVGDGEGAGDGVSAGDGVGAGGGVSAGDGVGAGDGSADPRQRDLVSIATASLSLLGIS